MTTMQLIRVVGRGALSGRSDRPPLVGWRRRLWPGARCRERRAGSLGGSGVGWGVWTSAPGCSEGGAVGVTPSWPTRASTSAWLIRRMRIKVP